jgi:hypothetical protein
MTTTQTTEGTMDTTKTRHSELIQAAYELARKYHAARSMPAGQVDERAVASIGYEFSAARTALRRFEERHPEVVS